MTLLNCQELRELELWVGYLWTVELDLILSITSTNLQKITFIRSRVDEPPPQGHPSWTQLDDCLCPLVERLGCGPQLEVSFYAGDMEEWWSGGSGLEKYLPRFYEKVVDKEDETVCLDG